MENKTDQQQETKTRYQMIKEGLAEPEGSEKGWKNLQPGKYNLATMDPEKALEIRRKGAEAIHKLHGEKKTAKQSLEKILTLKIDDDILAAADLPADLAKKLKRSNPDATIYDLIQIVAAGRAIGGNIKAAEYIRDTHGDAPKQQIELTESMTDQDREMLQQINARLQNAEMIQVIDQDSSSSEREKSREKEPKRE